MQRREWPGTRNQAIVLGILLLLGSAFFVDQAHLELATDDIAWLQGQAPTVFDQYRAIPHLFFMALHALVGANAVAALILIFAFHCLNTFLVYRFAGQVLADPAAALAAAGVFLINPITLSTLTWISCFSYVLGTTLALLAVLAFWRANEQGSSQGLLDTRKDGQKPGFETGATPAHAEQIRQGEKLRPRSKPGFWYFRGSTNQGLMMALALACFGAGLLCTHEIFFLPVALGVLGWYQGQPRRGAAFLAVGLALAWLANTFVYDFGRYGVEASRLFSLDFALAAISSALSSGLALTVAYPLSFLVKTLDFLRLCFVEPARWGMTALMLAAYVQFGRNTRAWRLHLALAAAFVALITPYIIRLYLTPDTVNYDISYALSGRVFYLPFTILALFLGQLVSATRAYIREHRWGWLALLVPLLAYGHALWLYDREDFLGLNVALQPLAEPVPPRWNPYADLQPAWLLLPALVVFPLVLWRIRHRALSKSL